MITGNYKIASLKYDDVISRLMEGQSIDIEEARRAVASLSFKEYHRLIEASADIVPPSGNPLSPQRQGTNAPPAGQGVPVPTPPGQPIQPGQPPAPAGQSAGQPPVPGAQVQQTAQQLVPPGSKVPVVPGKPGQVQETEEDTLLNRLRKLAGIKENCSAGATGAGSIAMAPAAMGKVKRRQVDEAPPKEYTRTAPPKTIVGDTKPHQASGELSATLAARKLKTASRKNNGLKP